MLTVVAALIQQDGRLLVCQRRKQDVLGLKWEFPGGKVQPGETPTEALARELREELGVAARIGREVYCTRFRYSEYRDELELIFYAAQREPGPVRNLAFEQILWAEPAALPALDFLPADRKLIARLAAGALPLG